MTTGRQNHIQSPIKWVINPPDLHDLAVLKFHSINDLAFLWLFVSFYKVFLSFLTILAVSSPDAIDLSTCTDGFFYQ